MFNVVLAVVFLVLGIGLGIVYNRLVIRHYPDSNRKFAYVLTVIVFLVFSGVLYLVISVNSGINTTITKYTIQMEQYINDKHPNNEFVKNGLDLKKINDDISQINKTVTDLKSILPTHQELGVNQIVYNLIVDYAIKELQKRLTVINYSAKVISNFANKDNVLTVASVTNGLRTGAIKLVNIIALIIVAVFAVVFMIYIVYSLVTARKEKKRKDELLTTEGREPGLT